MQSTRPLKVFLCHASADKPAVRKLYRYLRSKGMDPWLDAEKLLPGESWEVEIPRAIFDSDVILVCLSKNSINKEGYVQKEILFALDKAMEKPDGTIFIVPAKLEECDVPQRLNRYQWVDLYREDGRKRLMLSLNKRAAQLGPAVEQAIVPDDTLEREKMELEAKEKSARENAEREAVAKAAREKTEREAIEKVEREKAEQETKEKFARENAEREAVAKVGRELKERQAKEKLTRENEEREKTEKITREKKERETASSRVVEPKKSAGKVFPFELGGFGLLLIAGIFVVVAVIVANNLPTSAQPTPTQISVSTETPLVETSTLMPQPTKTIIPTPTLGFGSTMTGEDGATLVYVPAGEFTMGSDSSDQSDEKPEHQVDLPAFWIDQTEVTNKQYVACISGAGCTPPANTSSYTRSSYYGNTEFDEFPVIYVDWNQANAYCSWAGRRLPTEAEWEKAARGTDGSIYPWGNDTPNSTLLNYNQNVGDTTAVGNYQSGASLYGAYDMAGNVWEWVSSLYKPYPYDASDGRENMSSSDSRVLRGGSWLDLDINARSAFRSWLDPAFADGSIGFRCARSLP